MAVPLASAFVRLRPDADEREFRKAGEDAGKAVGDEVSKGIRAGTADGAKAGARDAKGQFAKGGQESGKSFADGFYRDSAGKLRQANGRFATDAQKAMLEGGTRAGQGFGNNFNRTGGGIIRNGFNKLKGELGPLLVPAGIGAAVLAIGKIGTTYEDNLNILRAVTKATGTEMQAVAAQARALGADINLPGVSAAGAAAAMTELAKAGFTVQEAMDAARGTLQLARVAELSEADAAEIAANAVNAFGISAKDTMFVVDELAAAANSSSISVREASFSFKQAAAVFSGLQGPAIGSKEAITELNTAIAILGNNGIKGSDAGTSLKQMLLQLTGPSEKAKGLMQELAFRAAGANISLEQQTEVLNGSKSVRDKALASIKANNAGIKLEGDIAYDATGKMRGLREIIALTAAGTKGMTQEERNYAITQIFGADASRAVLALLKGGLPVYDKQRKAVLASGAAADFAAAKNAGLKGAIDNVKSQFENMAISIYNAVKGPLTTAINGLGNLLAPVAGYISAFTGFVQRNIDTIQDWAIAIGLVTLAIKINTAMLALQAAGGLLAYAKGIRVITGTTRIWAAVQTYLNATLLANPVGLVVIAIAALVAAFVIAYRNSETFRKIVQGALSGIKVAAQAVASWFMGTLLPILKSVWQGIATGALWLWRNVIQPAWSGIQKAIAVAVVIIRAQIMAAIAVFKVIATVIKFLYNNVARPVFLAIGKVIEVFWFTAKIIFAALVLYLRNFVMPTLRFLYDKVVKPVFGLIGATISRVWNTIIKPVFNFFKTTFLATGVAIAAVYEKIIKPMFLKLAGFITGTVAPGFSKGVAAIRAAWAKVQEAARKPVAFVVNRVINPFIGGLNAAAKVVGLKDRIAPIQGFASGGKISGAGGFSDNRQAMVAGLGPVQLMGGEFVVNRRDTARALPLLRWVNAGMKGGPAEAARRIGKTPAREPGDGSEGWAFKDGGLVGWAKNVWGAVADPVGTVKKPFESLLSQVPGSGMVKDFLIGSAKRLLGGATKWLSSFGGGGEGGSFAYHGPKGGRVGAAAQFVQAQAGKPYVWASAGPGGYDCSGIVSAAYNILKGRNPYSHTFSTGTLPGGFFNRGDRSGPLLAGWSHPGQRPASARVGHMAGQIAGLPFESTGSAGVRVGSRARKVGEFASVGAARLAAGGVVPALANMPVRVFDNGGAWPSGTAGVNLSGRTEYVDPNRRGSRGGGNTYEINVTASPTAHPADVGREVVKAIKAFEQGSGAGWRK